MKIYSRFQINFISILISIIIYIFVIKYIPQLYKLGKSYIYFKSQPNIVKEYEDWYIRNCCYSINLQTFTCHITKNLV